MNTYPYIGCFNPRRIVDRTGHKRMVACGRCEACSNRKSAMSTLKVQLEDKGSKYCKFITLTYSNDYVPLTRFDKPDIFGYTSLLKKNYNGDFNQPFERIDYSDSEITLLEVKANLHGFIPVLCKKDAQLFLKRLRRQIDRFFAKQRLLPHSEYISQEDFKIRYYLVGEYGPVHFRPHYHILIWCESRLLHSAMESLVSKAWQYGRIDCQTPVNDVATYVASYVNGNCNLPRILKSREIKPFCLHSFHLGEKILKIQRDEVYELQPSEFVRRSLVLGKKIRTFNLWCSLTSFYFPRCRAYAECSESERLFRYTIFETASQWARTTSPARIVRKIVDYFVSDAPFSSIVTTPRQYRMLDYFFHFYDLVEYPLRPSRLSREQRFERFVRRVYLDISKSKHFIQFCCDSNPVKYLSILRKIDNFYKDMDLNRLNVFLANQEEYYQNHVFNSGSFAFMYDEISSYYKITYSKRDFVTSLGFRAYKSFQVDLFEKLVKHKEQNDLNKCFTY